MTFPLLSALLVLPLAGAVIIAFTPVDTQRQAHNVKRVALWTTLVTFLVSLLVLVQFEPERQGFQFVETYRLVRGVLDLRLGIDGISAPFVLLTALIMPIAILASWTVEKRIKDYLIAFLVLETLMIGVFVALDLVAFYVFFEGGLIPMFLIIGIWGGSGRVNASYKFFLFTLLGSVLMLVALVAMVILSQTTSIETLLGFAFPPSVQVWLWLAFFASFAVKMPMWPVHTWLPVAHVEAPTAGSVVLAAILLKMGGYGLLRFSLPMFPYASELFAPLVLILSVIAIIYASFVALAQDDIKKLVAYSSVAHMGFVTLGIFSMTREGIEGAIFQMVSHGFISGALFLCVGVLYDRTHTRKIMAFGGLVNRMPAFALLFMVFTLANIGLPGTSGFVGEFLTLIGTYKVSALAASAAALGVILSAAYGLWLYKRVVYGVLEKESLKTITDINRREQWLLWPLAILVVLFGLYPALLQGWIEPSVGVVLEGLAMMGGRS